PMSRTLHQLSDPEIQILGASGIIDCGFCSENLNGLTLPEREEHYELHFSAAPGEINNEPRLLHYLNSGMRARVSEIVAGCASLIPLLKRALLSSHAQGSTSRAVLCSDRAIHVSRTSLDTSWGCGYRNFQMACAALMDQNIQPDYLKLLSGSPSPGVRDIQRWIEDAWNAGKFFSTTLTITM
ncbi:hypothetical protein C0992_005903, partial [Termitomyces sp. T32_za158]